MTDSTNKNSLQTENFILKRKVEILKNLNAQNSTKYREVELRLTAQHKKKENEYITKIQQLQQLITKQKKGMRLLQIDSSSKQLSQSKILDDAHAAYKKEIKSLRHEVSQKQQKITSLEFRVYELETSSQQKEQERIRRSFAKKQQIASIAHELEEYRGRSLEIVKSNECLIKIQNTTKTKSDSSNTEKHTPKHTPINTPTATEPAMCKIYNIYSTALQRTLTEVFDEECAEAGFTPHGSDGTIIDCKQRLSFNVTLSSTPTLRKASTTRPIIKQIKKAKEYRTHHNKLVLKQLPINCRTHFWMNLYIEMEGEIIVTFLNRNCSVNMLLEMLKLSEALKEVFVNKNNIEMYAANEDFEDKHGFVLGRDTIISELGILNACMRCSNDMIGDVESLNHEKSASDVSMADIKLKLSHLQQSKSKPSEIDTNNLDIHIVYKARSGELVPDISPLTPGINVVDEHIRGGVCCIVL